VGGDVLESALAEHAGAVDQPVDAVDFRESRRHRVRVGDVAGDRRRDTTVAVRRRVRSGSGASSTPSGSKTATITVIVG
jgi:hypothetical protein